MVVFARFYITWLCLQGSTLHGCVCKVLHYMVVFARFYITWLYLQGSTLHGSICKVLHYMVVFARFSCRHNTVSDFPSLQNKAHST